MRIQFTPKKLSKVTNLFVLGSIGFVVAGLLQTQTPQNLSGYLEGAITAYMGGGLFILLFACGEFLKKEEKKVYVISECILLIGGMVLYSMASVLFVMYIFANSFWFNLIF